MSIEIEESDNYHIIKLNGEFDASLAEQSRSTFAELVDRATMNVRLDLDHIDFIDSSGIGAIVFLYKRLRCKELELILHNPQHQPLELIKLLRIDKIIQVVHSQNTDD